jgi:NCS1 nucleoside transporter family
MSVEHSTMEELGTEQVPKEQRTVSFLTLCLIWIGFTINGGLFLLGSIGANAGVSVFLTVIVLGVLLVCIYAAFGAYIGAKDGLPGTVTMRLAFGRKGQMIPSATMWIATWGWFGVQLGVMSSATHLLMKDAIGIPSNIYIHYIVWGIIMTTIGTYGYGIVAKMNKIAVPLLAVIFLWMIIAILNNYEFKSIFSYMPQGGATLSFWSALNILPAAGAALLIAGADTSRYAKSPKVAVGSVFVGYGVFTILVLIIALFGGAVAGVWDPATIMANVGLGALGVAFLLLAGITTNSLNVYYGGIAFANLTGLKRSTSSIITGVIGTLIALVGIYTWNGLFSFLTYEGAFLAPAGAVLVAEYFNIRKKEINIAELYKKDGTYNYSGGWHISAIISVIIGAIWGLKAPADFVPSVSAFLITYVIYYVLRKFVFTTAATTTRNKAATAQK